jgi:cobyrinic acid a,c-diamide synthase
VKITRQHIALKLASYLDGRMSLESLVEWAESAMMEGNFPSEDAEALVEAVARLGLADVRAFGLTWQDCREIFRSLGLSAKIDLVAA